MGARLLSHLSEPASGLFKGVVEHSELDQGGRPLHSGDGGDADDLTIRSRLSCPTVMPGLVAGIHVFDAATRRGWHRTSACPRYARLECRKSGEPELWGQARL